MSPPVLPPRADGRPRARVLSALALLGLVGLGAVLWKRQAPVAVTPEAATLPVAKGAPAVQRNLTVRGLVYGPYSRYTARLYNCDDQCQLLVDGRVVLQVGFGEDSGRVDITERVARGEPAATRLRFENVNRTGAVAYGFELWGDETTRLMHEECGQVGRLGCHGGVAFREGVAVWMEAPAYRPEGAAPAGGPARIKVTLEPDPAVIPAGERIDVAYRFSEEAGTAATLTARSAFFETPAGRAVTPTLGPYANKIVVPAGGSVSWKDRVYVPADVARAARAQGATQLRLHQTFTGFDAAGQAVTLRTTLRIRF